MNTAFAFALVRTAPNVPADVINTGNRFNVYRNNYLAGLISTLSTKFPVTSQLVGAEYFDAIAHSYVTETPPSSPLLDYYGEDFAEFLEAAAPLDPPAYLADVARVEWARCVASIATHKPALQISDQEGLEDAFKTRLQLMPGGTLIGSTYPVGSIWGHHQAEPVKPVSNWSPETVAVWWADGHVRQETAPPDTAPILRQLATGTPFLDILNDTTSEEQAVRLISTFTLFVNAGLLVSREENMEQLDHES